MAILHTRFHARSIDLSIGMNIILPEHTESWRDPPAVLYLLHGLSGDHTSWCRNSSIERYARAYNLAIVMPDAHKSFYRDMAHGSNYRALFAEEIPARINQWFKVSAERDRTFIAGSSMGGYGAFQLAWDRPDRFGAAASLSGALDLVAHVRDGWDDERLRTFSAVFDDIEQIEGGEYDLIHRVKTAPLPPDVAFYSRCGTDDYLLGDSRAFARAAAERGASVTYEESAGDHDWAFWDESIQRVLEWLPIDRL